MEVELSFLSDDFFDNSLVPYPNTGVYSKSLELDIDIDDYDDVQIVDENMVDTGDDGDYDGENDMNAIFISSIVLVRRGKEAAVVNKITPKKMAVRARSSP